MAGISVKFKRWFYGRVRQIPFVKRRVDNQIEHTTQLIREGFAADLKPGMTFIEQLPSTGLPQSEVLHLAEEYKSMGQTPIDEGLVSGGVYNGEDSLTLFNTKIYGMFTWTNPLHSDLFPDIRKMEAEVVRMCITMFNGGNDCCGTMTSGGTESIMLACKAFRDRAISRGVKQPEMLIPGSAHAAFQKATLTLGIKMQIVPTDPETKTVDVNKMASGITRNTCMLAGSCPDFPLGAIDCIEEIAKLGVKYDIPVHVDCCLGGFLLPFMDKAGYPLPPYDFRVPGVSSISCDTHKYGFAPKGSSVILYVNKELRRFQYYVVTDWPGGIYATPSLAGSRPGAIIASCWATMMHYGENGYIETTRKIIQTARYIRDGIRGIPHIFVFGEPLVSVIAIGSDQFDIYRLYAAMRERGWNLNALQFPSSFHLCCTLITAKQGVADRFLSDLRSCTSVIRANPMEKSSGMAAIYGLAQTIPDRTIVEELAMIFVDATLDTNTVKMKTSKPEKILGSNNGNVKEEFQEKHNAGLVIYDL